jgi:hypothetical protein
MTKGCALTTFDVLYSGSLHLPADSSRWPSVICAETLRGRSAGIGFAVPFT